MKKYIVLVILAATVALLPGCVKSQKVDAGPYTALGEMAGQITADLFTEGGRLVLIINQADRDPSTAVGAAIQAFQQRVKAKPGIQLVATETIEVPEVMVSGSEPLSPAKLLELINKNATADVMVSFVGMPRLTAEHISQLPARRPKLVTAVSYNPPSRALFQQGILNAAIIARPGAKATGATPQEIFDANYLVITVQNAEALPN